MTTYFITPIAEPLGIIDRTGRVHGFHERTETYLILHPFCKTAFRISGREEEGSTYQSKNGQVWISDGTTSNEAVSLKRKEETETLTEQIEQLEHSASEEAHSLIDQLRAQRESVNRTGQCLDQAIEQAKAETYLRHRRELLASFATIQALRKDLIGCKGTNRPVDPADDMPQPIGADRDSAEATSLQATDLPVTGHTSGNAIRRTAKAERGKRPNASSIAMGTGRRSARTA